MYSSVVISTEADVSVMNVPPLVAPRNGTQLIGPNMMRDTQNG